jgi:alkylhydroperoxidase family enzyme
MVDKRGWPEDDEVKTFLDVGYTKEQILELIVGIAQKTISNYVNHIAQTPLDEAAKEYKWEPAD